MKIVWILKYHYYQQIFLVEMEYESVIVNAYFDTNLVLLIFLFTFRIICDETMQTNDHSDEN